MSPFAEVIKENPAFNGHTFCLMKT